MEKTFPEEKGRPSQPSQLYCERLYERKVDPFALSNGARACSDCLTLTELTQLGDPKWRKVGPTRTPPSQKSDLATRLTLLAYQTFCLSYKWLVT